MSGFFMPNTLRSYILCGSINVLEDFTAKALSTQRFCVKEVCENHFNLRENKPAERSRSGFHINIPSFVSFQFP
jgi:hypothetical protein